MRLKEFLNSTLTNAWLHTDHMEIYIRKGRHLINGKIKLTLDVANVQVEEAHQGKGIFRNYLNRIESESVKYGFEGVMVESILQKRLLPFLKGRGYEQCNDLQNSCPNLFKSSHQIKCDLTDQQFRTKAIEIAQSIAQSKEPKQKNSIKTYG